MSIPEMDFTEGWNQAWELHLMRLEKIITGQLLSGNVKTLKLI